MYPLQNDPYSPIVGRVLRIDAVTWGDPKRRLIARYQGKLLYEDSAEAYDLLADALRPLEVTPMFRLEKGTHVVVLIPGVFRPSPSKTWVNLVFFALTVVSVLVAGTLYTTETPIPTDPRGMISFFAAHLKEGVPFTISLLAILLAHEFGHYLVSRFHKTAASLPYFIPFPFSPFGTMGAVIIQREPHKNKRILLDIGMAGPLAGFLVSLPILILGLALSKVERLPVVIPPGQGLSMEGNSILYLLLKYVMFGQWLPSPASFSGWSPWLYWVRYFFTGQPTPLGGLDVMIHPVAFAAWAGLLVTALNLIPAGQLDGGHIVHGLLGERAPVLLPFILGGLGLLGFVWSGWWLWALLIFFLGRTYAEPLDQITPLDPKRKVLAVLCVILFFLVFTPVPLMMFYGG